MPVKTALKLLMLLAVMMPEGAPAEDAGIAGLFATQGVKGTLVARNVRTGVTVRHDDLRAATRFPVASTFKILNTLIGLQSDVVRPTGIEFRWDGTVHPFSDWNRDQTLESAFRVSCVWCYQDIARRVGPDIYRAYLGRIGYGLLRDPFVLTDFWLDGSLMASAMEQIILLQRLVRRDLPFDAFAYDALRDIMMVETAPRYTLRAKTGWAARSEPQIGWYVGYVDTPDATWVFALNIDLRSEKDLALRQVLVKGALRLIGALPE